MSDEVRWNQAEFKWHERKMSTIKKGKNYRQVLNGIGVIFITL